MKLTATKAMRYAGQNVEPGDHFEVSSERDFKLLQAIGKAVVREDEEPAPREQTRALKAEDEAAAEPRKGGDKLKAKGRYQRRDLRAAD